MTRRRLHLGAALCVLLIAVSAGAWDPVPVVDDPLVRMPGTQPGVTSLEAPDRCLNCHAGYNPAVEPGHNWQGSMMAQAARDFLYWSCLTVSAQDSIWAVGTPNATDICLRCHMPKGWLEGRSDPTNGSAMGGSDFDGVQCDFCHTAYDPFFEDTYAGVREGEDWLNYWDETNQSDTPSNLAAEETWLEDRVQSGAIDLFDGTPFYGPDFQPAEPNYLENGSGQYFISANSDKRASFADAAARHQMLYSRYHKSKYFCQTCHDVSNPVLANLGDTPSALTTEDDSAFSFFHVERTFSEFMLSAYGQQGGAPGIGPYDPAVFETSDPNNWINKCQDCHMRDTVGVACDKRGVPVRPDDSVEHPNSGQPLHDMTGGNIWVSQVLASAVPGSPEYDAFNNQQLYQGPAALTLDMNAGLGIDPVALLDGVGRAREQLELAASIDSLSYDANSGALSFRVQNQTGHKLISGFPEGRRMFVNVKAYAADGTLLCELNPYDATAGTLKGLGHDGTYYYDPDGTLPDPLPLVAGETHVDELVYEMKPTSTLTGEDKTFHFALATGRYKDNRIPPMGFDIDAAAARISVPVSHGADDPNLYTAEEYAGGYDDVATSICAGASSVEIGLYYQTTSREYIEFLRDEIKGYADEGNTRQPTLSEPSPSEATDPAYLIQTDPFFGQLKAWGDTLWALWKHNMNVHGAAPYLMTSATWGTPPEPCGAPTPTLLEALPGHQQVTLSWTDEHTADPDVVGYDVYYDQAGKSQLVAELGLTTSYTDSGLSNGVEYCYKVVARYADCSSGFSNILCATPSNQGCQAPVPELLDAAPGNRKVTLTWTDEHSADPDVTGYRVYRDGAAVADPGLTTTYTDTGLSNGTEYCYTVTTLYANCESEPSNELCATPAKGGGGGRK